jgi:hypothetical protein
MGWQRAAQPANTRRRCAGHARRDWRHRDAEHRDCASPPQLNATAPSFVPGVQGAPGAQGAVPEWSGPLAELRTEVCGQLSTIMSFITNLVPDTNVNVNAVRAPSYVSAARGDRLATQV